MKKYNKLIIPIILLSLVIICCSCNKRVCKCITYDFNDSIFWDSVNNIWYGVWNEVKIDEDARCVDIYYNDTTNNTLHFCFEKDYYDSVINKQ